MSHLFDVDVRGLQQTLIHDAPRILLEPLANALDTAATEIIVRFTWARGIARYEIEDNDPRGFARITDAFTMFAPSERKAIATARGRFGFGEKEFVALAYPGPVSISTTSGTVTFDGNNRTVQKGAGARRSAGSAISARVRCDRAQADAFIERIHSVIVPEGVTLILELEGERTTLVSRATLRRVQATLPTVLADADGLLRPTRRQTTLTLHTVAPGETPTLFELGLPVVPHGGAWHVNVHQKIPLARSRDSVTRAFEHSMHVAVIDAAADLLTPEMATADWVTGALAAAAPETVRDVVHRVHGADAVIADPSCLEATKRAIDVGRTVVHGGTYPAAVWAQIKAHDVLKPAGQHAELRGDIPVSVGGGEAPIPPSEWRPEWRRVAAYAAALAHELLGREVGVAMYRISGGAKRWLATWNDVWGLSFNVATLRTSWWHDEVAIDELLIHEFAHASAKDHLSDDFHEACCRLGARLRGCSARIADFDGERANNGSGEAVVNVVVAA